MIGARSLAGLAILAAVLALVLGLADGLELGDLVAAWCCLVSLSWCGLGLVDLALDLLELELAELVREVTP